MINYTFIIPHKNTPELLERCINSIPERADIEIIVVDDNSEANKRPVIKRKNIHLIFIDEGQSKGAGHARNVGLECARGQWILFADADDSYTDKLIALLDSFKDIDEDVIFFNHYEVNGSRVELKKINEKETTPLKDYSFKVKYATTAPWYKAVRLRFLMKHRIKFEECPVGNDIFYTYQVGYFARDNYRIIDAALYNYYINPSSITHKKKHNECYYLTICKHHYQRNAFYRFIGMDDKTRSMLSKFAAILLKKGWSQFVLCFKVYMTHKNEIERDRNYFIEVIKSRETNG